jgi:hypothetical protein
MCDTGPNVAVPLARTNRARHGSDSLNSCESLIEIGEDVVDVLNAD